MRPPIRRLAAAGALLVTATLTACTSGSPTAASSAPAATTVASPSAVGATSVAGTPVGASSVGVPTSSPAGPSPSPGPSTGASAPLSAGCASSALRLTVVKQASASQHAFADLELTNTGSSTCSLVGYPGVSLSAGGAPLGQPAARSAVAVVPVSLAPGATAHAQLSVSTACNAAASDTVHVIPPNQTVALTGPLRVFGCAMSVDPYSAS